MERLAACLLVLGIFTMIFSLIMNDYPIPQISLLQLGSIPQYVMLIAGMFAIAASYFLADYRRRATGVNEVRVAERSKGSSAEKETESTFSQSDPSELVQAAQKAEALQRPKIHLEILMQLQSQYGTQQFNIRDAVKVVEDRLNGDASSTRLALHWGQTQGKVVKRRHGIYQFC